MKNFSMFLVLLLFIVFSACTNSKTIELYVSVEGNNAASGNIKEPLATLPAAVQKIRDLRKDGNTNPAIIYLREGRHQLNKALVLGIDDGRTPGDKQVELDRYGAGESTETPYLTITAYPGESPVLSAGTAVDGWELATEGVTELPEEATGNVWVANMPKSLNSFYTLYDSEGRLKRARGKGFVPTKTGDKKTLFFPEGALKNWDNLEDVEVNIRPNRAWMINMLPLASVDEVNRIAKTGVSATYDLGKLPAWVHTKDGTQAWVENVIEALDEPGEWVVNTKTRKIYLWPANPAKDGSPQGILAPSTSELIRVEGEINYDGPEDKPVKGIAISGITFTHADRWGWTNDDTRLGWGMQHDWDLFDRPTALIRFRGAEDCSVTDCNFQNSGGTGIRLDLHAQRNRIENCEFAHLGEAGIILAGYGTGTKDVNHHNDIRNNHIHHFSEITWHSPGIWAWQSGHNHIAHNYVHHSGYAAVIITNRVEPDRPLNGEGGRTVRHAEIPQSVIDNTKETYESWKEREKYIHARHNLFEYNEISHTVQLLSDGNGIYVSGAGTGNIIRYNYLHDNLEHSFPSCIRCDDDQHETLIYGNVLYNNYGFSAGIVSKGRNDIVNNFIVAPGTKPTWGYISYEWVKVTDSKSQHNIIISHSDGGNAQGERPIARSEDGDPNMDETNMDFNLYYHATNPDWVNDHLARMRSAGNEKNSLFGDPLFTDPANGDFSFKEGSPAPKLGIEELDVSKMGLLHKN
ncbi:right-handed parallel beta-helix repeat-containing protein [Mangrovibacterium sp.]|uniref:right-handed parallel beta-helix repeat-containing protein n=1 Tax=Mangrovibacterium sp. TaxID=1961364 RepID=UPI003563FBFA